MGQRSRRARAESAADVVNAMGRERRALMARKATIAMLQLCATLCLACAVASLTGYLPRAVGPALVLAAASAAGFVLSIVEARKA